MASQRFPNNPWSYEACSTPSIGSYLFPAPTDYPAPIITVVGDSVADNFVIPRDDLTLDLEDNGKNDVLSLTKNKNFNVFFESYIF